MISSLSWINLAAIHIGPMLPGESFRRCEETRGCQDVVTGGASIEIRETTAWWRP